MKEKICPIDGRPCDRFCSHRYKNRPEGGCFLTDFAETMSEVFADPDNQPVRRKENYRKRCGLFWNDRQRQKRRGGKAMELHEIERDIEALKSSPLVLVCRTPQGRVKAMSLQKCVETGSSFLYVAVDELDALLDRAINGTA